MAKEFKSLDNDIIEFFESRFVKFNMPLDLRFLYQDVTTQKQLVKLVKIPDFYAYSLKKDILVQINSIYFDDFDEEINTILIDSAIDMIVTDLEKGTFKINKANFVTSKGILDKYSYDKVYRAIETERLYENNKKNDEQ